MTHVHNCFSPTSHTGIKKLILFFFFSWDHQDLYYMQIFIVLFCVCFLVKISTNSCLFPTSFFVQLSTEIKSSYNCLRILSYHPRTTQLSQHSAQYTLYLGLAFHGMEVQRYISISLLGSACESERAGSQQCITCDLMESWEPAVTGYEMSLLC